MIFHSDFEKIKENNTSFFIEFLKQEPLSSLIYENEFPVKINLREENVLFGREFEINCRRFLCRSLFESETIKKPLNFKRRPFPICFLNFAWIDFLFYELIWFYTISIQ
jgi:hypothetical protein